MNERIRELAEQAVQLVAGEHTKGDESRLNTDSYHVKDLINEKFAELIVRECAELATKEYNNRSSIHGNDLLEHFGVEE